MMIEILVTHLFKERIYPLLPIVSTSRSYVDVEANVYFLSSRSVLLNVAISQSIEPIISNILDLLDTVLETNIDCDTSEENDNYRITDSHINDDAIHSICLLLRLMSDVVEYYWDFSEKSDISNKNVSNPPMSTDEIIKIFEKQHNSFSGTIVGFSIHKSNFHLQKPNELSSDLSNRLVNTLSKLKFQYITYKLLTTIHKNSSYFKTSLSFNDLIPNFNYFQNKKNAHYQMNLKKNNISKTTSQYTTESTSTTTSSIRTTPTETNKDKGHDDSDTNENIQENIENKFSKGLDDIEYNFDIEKKVDLTIDSIQRFVAASNPKEFKKFINDKILQPANKHYLPVHGVGATEIVSESKKSPVILSQSPSSNIPTITPHNLSSLTPIVKKTTRSNSSTTTGSNTSTASNSIKSANLNWNDILTNFDSFGCVFLTKHSILNFLEMIKNFSKTLNKSIFTCVLLFFSTKSIMYWVMARSNEFIEISRSLTDAKNIINSSNYSSSNSLSGLSDEQIESLNILKTVNSLFSDLYSLFNISNILSNPHSLPNMHINPSHSTSNANHTVSTTTAASNTANNPNILSPISKKPHLHANSSLHFTSDSHGNSPHTPSRDKNITPLSIASNYSNREMMAIDSNLLPNPVSPICPPNKCSLTAMKSFELSQQISNTDTSSRSSIHNWDMSNEYAGDYVPSPSMASSNKSTSMHRDYSHMFSDDSSQSYNEDVSHLKNALELYTIFDETESLVHTSVLKFLSTLLLFDSSVFQEINSLSFDGICDYVDPITHSKINSQGSTINDKEKTLSIKQLSHGLKKLTNLTPLKSEKASKPIDFLILILNIYNGTQPTSENAIIISMRVLLTIFTLSASVSLANSKLQCVLFAKRLMPAFCSTLEIDTKWNVGNYTQQHLTTILENRSTLRGQFQLEYFAASLQLSTDEFLSHLYLHELTATLDTKLLVLYTEGFRIFFHLPCCRNLRKRTAIKLSNVLKSLFYNVSTILWKEFPIIDDENVSNIIDAIIDGTIVELFSSNSFFLKDSPSAANSSTSVTNATTPNSIISNVGFDQDNWVTHPIITSLNNKPALNDSGITENTLKEVNNYNYSSLISPTARRSSGNSSNLKRSSLLSHTKSTSDSPSSVPGVINTSVHNSLRSPLRQTTGDKGTDEGLSSMLKKTISTVIDDTVTFTNHEQDSEIRNARRIILNIFSIFKRTANFIILPHNEDTLSGHVATDFKQIVKPIFISIIDVDPVLEFTASSFINMLITYMSNLDDTIPSEVIIDYHLFCSYSITLFATALFDLNLTNRKRELFLDTVSKLLELRNSVSRLAKRTDRINDIINVEDNTFGPLVAALNRGLFVSLHSNKSAIQILLTKTYSHYYDSLMFYKKSIRLLDDKELGNIEFIEAMSKGNYVSSGSVAFQRKCKNNILKYITKADDVLYDCFEAIFKKWLQISKLTLLSPADISDFRSFAGLLASISGTMLTKVENNDEIPCSSNENKINISKKVNYFIGKQCQWLNNEHLLTRENSRDILSLELHPLSFKLLFHNLKQKINEIRDIDLASDNSDYYFIILEQISIIIRTILRREYVKDVLFLFSLDIINLIDDLVDLVEKILHSTPRYVKGIIHLSKMFKAIEESEKCLAIKGHFSLRNRWLKVIINWFKFSISKDLDLSNLSKPHREMDLPKRDSDILYLDTSIESSKAITYLTYNLPLEAPYSVTEMEYKRSIGFEFRNYFGILLKGIEKTINIHNCPISLKHKINLLNENLITSLKNLSNANIEPALQYTLHMGFSDDIKIRKAFLNVFINVVRNYPSHMAKNQKDKIDATNNILTFLIENVNITTSAIGICPPSQVDEFAVGILTTFESRNAGHIIVSELVRVEIQKAVRFMDILRRNSVATRVLSIYSKSKGNSYLINLIKPLINELIEHNEHFEVEKLSQDNNINTSQIKLFKKYLSKFLDTMISTIDQFPPALTVVCQKIYDEVSIKFPDSAIIAVGSFVFLRFICPALVSPQTENIVGHIEPPIQRSLVQIAKLIQNLANNPESTSRLPSLQNENEFLNDCKTRIFIFLQEVSDTKKVMNISWQKQSHENNLHLNFDFFHNFFYNQCLSLRAVLVSELTSLDDISFLKKTLDLSDTVLGTLGQPNWQATVEIPKFVKENMEKYPQLFEFMTKNAIKTSDASNNNTSYVQEVISTDGNPVLSFSFKRFGQENISVDLLVYRAIQVYSRFWTSKHYLIMNVSEFYPNEDETYYIISLFFSLVPEEAYENCQGLYHLNVTKEYLNFWSVNSSFENKYVTYGCPYYFVNTVEDEQLINDIGFRQQILYLVDDMRVSLHDIKMFDIETETFKPVVMRLGNKFFQVLHEEKTIFDANKQGVFYEVNVNNIYEISNVQNVSVSFEKSISNEFTIYLSNGDKLFFTTQKYLEIIKMFSFSIAKNEDELGPGNRSITSRKESDSLSYELNLEIISQILIVAIVGLFNEDNEVKNTAYNLLAETQLSFKLDLGIRLRRSIEIYVPDDCNMFLKQITKALSTASPELTGYFVKMTVDALENEVFKADCIPQIICCISYWIPNLYDYVYLSDDENGPEALSYLIRVLIRLTLIDSRFTSVYLQQIWYVLALESHLTDIIVEEVINYALDRDSENRDWACVLPLITGLSTVDSASYIIRRLMNILDSFLPSFQVDISTHSWSELTILVRIAIPLFFESSLLAQMFLPDLLFIISLLIDQGPKSIRGYFHELLMNVCHSLAINESLTDINRRTLDTVCSIFSQQKAKFNFGFRQEINPAPQSLNFSSFASKFSILEHFISNILITMENADEAEAAHWKTKYKKYLMDSIFKNESYLSARAMMILGIIGRYSTSERLCINMLSETLEITTRPDFNEEDMFVLIAHIFTYTKVVQGLDPSIDLMKQLFWYGAALTESPYPIIFEGGLFLLGNCLKRLYMYTFESGSSHLSLKKTLLNSRQFAADLLTEHDLERGIIWNEDSFAPVLISIILKGLTIPFVKPIAIANLEQFFRNAYFENRTNPEVVDYLSFMFVLYLLSSSDNFIGILDTVEFRGEMTVLDEDLKAPKIMMDWLASDNVYSNILLYQGACLFSSNIVDEATKLRFALITRYLLSNNPRCVFKYYSLTRTELRKMSSMAHNAKIVTVVFEIITLLVQFDEFEHLQDFFESFEDLLTAQGLYAVANINHPVNATTQFKTSAEELNRTFIERKRYMTKLLARMVYPTT